jgi:hypothetical protein
MDAPQIAPTYSPTPQCRVDAHYLSPSVQLPLAAHGITAQFLAPCPCGRSTDSNLPHVPPMQACPPCQQRQDVSKQLTIQAGRTLSETDLRAPKCQQSNE